MGLGGTVIERMDDRLDALEASLAAALPTRTIKRSLMHYTDHTDTELAAGVVMLVSGGEGDYNKGLGMVAREGVQRVLLVGHLKVAEDAAGAVVEAAELDLIEEIKAWARTNVPGMSLRLDSVQHSRQIENPYGWLVAYLDAGPPRSTTYGVNRERARPWKHLRRSTSAARVRSLWVRAMPMASRPV